jgi:hypothetical protein
MSAAPEFTERQLEFLRLLPASSKEIADAMGINPTSVEDHRNAIIERGVDLAYDRCANEWDTVGENPAGVDEDGPDPSELTERETFIVRNLQQGVDIGELADDLDERESVIHTHFKNLEEQGWRVYHDEEAGLWEIEGDHTLRSSEHIGTRTRKANRWWEIRHNALERNWKRLEPTDISMVAKPGHEDWVTHMTDLHAGDRVRDYAGEIVYATDDIPSIMEYITSQSISLSEKHNSVYDTAHLLYGGDMVTNEAIYEGQFEDLDAWLDEQVDVMQNAMIKQILTFAEHFETVNVVGQIGNHGVNRANGTSKHNNADLLLYKAVRNFISNSQDHWGELENVRMQVGEARPFTPIKLRGGKIHGQLRHGQDRKPQADTSARLKEWMSTLLDTINSSWGAFDVAWMGHHHVSGRVPWNGPPIIVSGSPKPAGDYVEKLGVKGAVSHPKEIAHCHGVSDDGITSVWPIDTRHYDVEEPAEASMG